MIHLIKSIARRVELDYVYHVLYRVPKSTLQKSIREGGPIEQRKTRKGKEAMIRAAECLPEVSPVPPEGEKSLYVHFLTGKNHWYQTLFCFLSLQHFSKERITPVLYSDGSLSKGYCERFRRVVPWVEIQTLADIEARLDRNLPVDQYPLLREWRQVQPLTRKLIDLHAGSEGWKLLLDSDMLFFKKPDFILSYLRNPQVPCYMVDVDTAYGYSPQLRYRLANGPIPEASNIGIFGLKSDEVDFDQIQYWLRTMVEEEGTKYNVTQALCSLIFSGRDCAVAPPHEYIVFPSLEEGQSPTTTLHHYVSESKRSYFQYGWRRVLSLLNNFSEESLIEAQ